MASKKMMSGASSSLSSPRDVPPGLNALDNLLRCPICFEFFNTAMLLPGCSHNYCSLCIRKYLTFKKQCPSCTTHVTDSMLKNNRLLDEIITKFIHLRSSLIPLLKIGSATPVKADVKDVTPTQKKLKKKAVSTSKQKTPRTLQQLYSSKILAEKNDCDDDIQILETPAPSKCISSTTTGTSPELSMATQTSKSQCLEKGKKDPPVGIVKPLDFKDHDDDFVKKTPKLRSPMSSKKRRASSQRTPKSEVPAKSVSTAVWMKEDSQPSTSKSCDLTYVDWSETSVPLTGTPGERLEPPELSQPNSRPVTPSSQERVACPVCTIEVRESRMNTHLDLCLSSGEKKGALRKRLLCNAPSETPPVLRRHPMHKLVYTLLSEKDIKAKLREVGLSTKGERHILVRRHQEFTLMYNAQCDALNPKSAKEIAAEIAQNEGLKCGYLENPPENQMLKIEKGANPKEIEKAQQTYVHQHKNQFKELVKLARQKMKTKVGKTAQSISGSVEPLKCETTVSSDLTTGSEDNTTTTTSAEAENLLLTFPACCEA